MEVHSWPGPEHSFANRDVALRVPGAALRVPDAALRVANVAAKARSLTVRFLRDHLAGPRPADWGFIGAARVPAGWPAHRSTIHLFRVMRAALLDFDNQ